MAYARELDELKQELRQSTAGTIVLWARVDGLNVQVSATSGHCTFEVFDFGGTSIQGPTNIDGTLVGSEHDRFDISVNAISTLGEDYYVKVLWRQASGSVTYLDVIYFDVVLYPWGGPVISLNDLLEEQVDVGETLDRMGVRLGYTTGTTAQQTMAAIYAVRAHAELDSMIRSQVRDDRNSLTGLLENINRPHLIVDRRMFNRIERKLAMKLIYQGDRDLELYEHWNKQAQDAWASIGPLKYDVAQDLVPENEVIDAGRAVVQRRVQS